MKLLLYILILIIIVILMFVLVITNMMVPPVVDNFKQDLMPDGIIQSYNISPRDPVDYNDVIRQYDYRKIIDPLEEPTRRVPRHEIQPFYLKQMIDIPTRGYPDNFTQIGILTKDKKDKNNYQNQILRLFSRQDYPGSNRYTYYTMVNSALDQIKIPVYTKNKKELYDDDIIYIKELHGTYKVNLHNYDAPKYYPDIL